MESDSAAAIFVADAFRSRDTSCIAEALGELARAKGMKAIAQETGFSREQLYRSFSKRGNPNLKTFLAVMKSLGLELVAQNYRPPGEPYPSDLFDHPVKPFPVDDEARL